ncbi:unnamed protein product [Trichogramma brassicae]|uniref:Uncharacterized protein n=1 Tax=Trichogramma brassicae TaxID=86971 RepID=A0A6H5HUW2_9HYME|nr:unnamed protein product [Trichogramma brassicae]
MLIDYRMKCSVLVMYLGSGVRLMEDVFRRGLLARQAQSQRAAQTTLYRHLILPKIALARNGTDRRLGFHGLPLIPKREYRCFTS